MSVSKCADFFGRYTVGPALSKLALYHLIKLHGETLRSSVTQNSCVRLATEDKGQCRWAVQLRTEITGQRATEMNHRNTLCRTVSIEKQPTAGGLGGPGCMPELALETLLQEDSLRLWGSGCLVIEECVSTMSNLDIQQG